MKTPFFKTSLLVALLVAVTVTVASAQSEMSSSSAAPATAAPAASVTAGVVIPPSELETLANIETSSTPASSYDQGTDTSGKSEPVLVFGQPIQFVFLVIAGGMLLAAFAILLVVTRTGHLNSEFTRPFMMIIIIFAALFLIPTGYSSQQAAPVYGLLGTIVGYLFGKSSTEFAPPPGAPPVPQPAPGPPPEPSPPAPTLPPTPTPAPPKRP